MEKTLFYKDLEAGRIIRENFSRSTYKKMIHLFAIGENHAYNVETVYNYLQNKNVTESELLQLMNALTDENRINDYEQ